MVLVLASYLDISGRKAESRGSSLFSRPLEGQGSFPCQHQEALVLFCQHFTMAASHFLHQSWLATHPWPHLLKAQRHKQRYSYPCMQFLLKLSDVQVLRDMLGWPQAHKDPAGRAVSGNGTRDMKESTGWAEKDELTSQLLVLQIVSNRLPLAAAIRHLLLHQHLHLQGKILKMPRALLASHCQCSRCMIHAYKKGGASSACA